MFGNTERAFELNLGTLNHYLASIERKCIRLIIEDFCLLAYVAYIVLSLGAGDIHPFERITLSHRKSILYSSERCSLIS
jgi:hypothetical protein